MHNLASGYLAAGKLNLALPLLEETLKLTKAKLGADHPETITSMNNLAVGYREAGKLELALPLLEETLNLLKAKRGANHPATLTSMGNLATIYCEANDVKKASATFREYIASQRKLANRNDSGFAAALATVALKLLMCREYATAEEMLRECLGIREQPQPDAWTTFNTRSLLGEALIGQKKYGTAEPLLVKGYQGMKDREKTILPLGSTRVAEALDRLVAFYNVTKKPDEAKKWRAERAKYPAELAPTPRAAK